MLNEIFCKTEARWSGFKYNYSWSDWVSYIDGRIPKASIFIPVIGYILLFNDQVSGVFEFYKITDRVEYGWGLDTKSRLRFIYYGLFFLGISNFIYRLKKPYVFRFGKNIVDYTKTAMEIFTFGDFLSIHNAIRGEGHLTRDGKYYDSEWEGFRDRARNRGEGTERPERNGNWASAKDEYGSLLRSILREHFFKYDIKNRFWLSCCLFLSTVGYVFLIIPSVDLFIKITLSTIR